VYVNTDMFPSNSPGEGIGGISTYSFPKTDLLQSTPVLTNMTRFDDFSGYGQTMQPITNFGTVGNNAPMLSALPSTAPTSFRLRADWTNTTGPNAQLPDTPTDISTAPYQNPPLANQPVGGRTVSTIDARLTANVYQVGNTIYAVHSTTVGGNAA